MHGVAVNLVVRFVVPLTHTYIMWLHACCENMFVISEHSVSVEMATCKPSKEDGELVKEAIHVWLNCISLNRDGVLELPGG